MSQAIPAFTPVLPPYQGNPQQQISATLAPPSSSMGNGDVIVLGGVIAVTLLGVGGFVAATQLGTSSAKKPPIARLPPTPVKKEESAQVKSTPGLTEEIPSPQPTPAPQHPLKPASASTEEILSPPPGPHFEPTPVSTNKEIPFPMTAQQYITLLGLPGKLDEYGVYREQQEKGDGLCEKCAMNTILYKFFGAKKVITKEKFREKIPGPGTNMRQSLDLASENGLDTRAYYSEDYCFKQVGGAGIAKMAGYAIIEDGIEDADAFIISSTSKYGSHAIAMVRMTAGGGFHLSDSRNKDKQILYPGTAAEALLDYKRKNNRTVNTVTTFHRSAFAQGRCLNDPLTAAPLDGNGVHEALR